MTSDVRSANSHVMVRDAVPGDWRIVRELRLTGLRDAPEAFWSSYEQEAGASDERWKDRVVTRTWFIAELLGKPVGLAALSEDGAIVQLVAMWVAPQARGRGVGAALVQHAVELARERGGGMVELWVNEDNVAARRLYERSEFRPTGDRQVMPGGDRNELRMSRTLRR